MSHELNKKKKIKEIKKLKQFSPYFANLFKSDKKSAGVMKSIVGLDPKLGANQKLFKIYGVHKSLPRYKKVN